MAMTLGPVPTPGAGLNGGTTGVINTLGNGTTTRVKAIDIYVSYNNGAAPTISETVNGSAGSNTYVAGTATSNGSTRSGRHYTCTNVVSAGASHTFSALGPTALCSIVVTTWYANGAISVAAAHADGLGSGSNITVGGGSASLTPPQNGSIILAGISFGTGPSGATATGGFTLAADQAGAGGTNFGGLVLYQIQTTATTIAAGTTIATSTLGDYISSSIVLIESSGESIMLISPSQYEVHQLNGSTASIQIAGTASGATEDIEASFNGGAYATIATAVVGSFSGTLSGQVAGQGTLTVRKKTTTTTFATVADVGVGDTFIPGGDSLAEGRGTNAQSYTHATLKAVDFRQDNAWKNGNDPSDTGTSIGSHWPLLATLLMADRGYPVAFITTGEGGTDVAGSNNTWVKPNAQYAGMTATVTNSTVAAVKAVLMQLGPNAIVNSNNAAIAKATYTAALGTFAGNIATDLPGSPPVFVGLSGQVTTGSPPDRRTAEDNIRGGILDAVTASIIKMGPNLLGQAYTDGVHPQTDALLLAVAQRWYLCLKEQLYDGAVGSSRGPRLVSASWNSTRNQITVIFSRALKTGLTFSTAAWIVNDVGGLGVMTISSIAYHGSNSNALLLNISASATGAAASTRLTFGSGEDATGVVIPLSTDITLPVGGPIQIPAEPIFAVAVQEAPTVTAQSTQTLGSFTQTSASAVIERIQSSLALSSFLSTTVGSVQSLHPTITAQSQQTLGSFLTQMSATVVRPGGALPNPVSPLRTFLVPRQRMLTEGSVAPKKTLFEHDANAVLDYTYDWTNWFLDNPDDSVLSFNFVNAVRCQIDAQTQEANNVLSVLLSMNGESGNEASLTCRIVTEQGRTDDCTLWFFITER